MNIKTDCRLMRQSVAVDNAKMRVLILSAILACVAAAPSGLFPYGAFPIAPASPYAAFPFAPVSPYAALSVAPVLVAPEVPAGDIQAAAIDAQVKIADQARSLADQARELAEQAAENKDEGVDESNDLAKARSEEAFWASEEKKWQALNEAQIAEARLASAAAVETAPEAEEKSEIKSEAAEVKSEDKMEMKATEIEKPAEPEMKGAEMKEAEKKDDTVEVKAAPEASKPEDPFAAYKSPVLSPIAIAPGFNFQPYVAPISYQAAYRSSYPIAAVQPNHPAFPYSIYQPAIAVKHAW
ncbi:pupal cuticle protein PCP52-like [Pararge aegeria]|nr:pupal cuticle protein PCP52-like [Pararge aegeria]